MISFVKDVEPQLEKNQNQYVQVDERRVGQIVRGFATDWKRGIESINHDIMRSFSNLKKLEQRYYRYNKLAAISCRGLCLNCLKKISQTLRGAPV